jgi:hypothetical protein
MTDLSRRQIIAGAVGAAAGAALPAVAIAGDSSLSMTFKLRDEHVTEMAALKERALYWPKPPFVDRQQFFDGEVEWTFYERRREWTGVYRDQERQATIENDPVRHPEGREDPEEWA